MRLLHSSFEKNRESILKHGLCVRFSTSGVRRVWVCKPFKGKWAARHVCRRHREKAANVIVLVVNVPDSWLTRYADGVYFCDRDVPPAHIEEVRGASPA